MSALKHYTRSSLGEGRVLCGLILLLCFFPAPLETLAQPVEHTAPLAAHHDLTQLQAEAEEAIQDKLGRLLKRIAVDDKDPTTADRYAKELGFQSFKEAFQAKAGTPLPVFRVALDDLKKYKPGSQPDVSADRMLISTPSWLIPVTVTNNGITQLRSAATVVMGKKGDTTVLRVSQIASPELIRQVVDARIDIDKGGVEGKACSCFVVWIPAMDRYFLGNRSAGLFMLKVLEGGPGGLQKGDLLPATKVFDELSRESKTGQYDFPNPHNRQKPKPTMP